MCLANSSDAWRVTNFVMLMFLTDVQTLSITGVSARRSYVTFASFSTHFLPRLYNPHPPQKKTRLKMHQARRGLNLEILKGQRQRGMERLRDKNKLRFCQSLARNKWRSYPSESAMISHSWLADLSWVAAGSQFLSAAGMAYHAKSHIRSFLHCPFNLISPVMCSNMIGCHYLPSHSEQGGSSYL